MRAVLKRRPLLAASVVFAAAAAALFAAGIWVPMPASDDRADLAAATAASVAVVVCLVGRFRPDKEKLFLVDVIVRQHEQITRRASQAPTIPMPGLGPARRRSGRGARLP